jgi:hypothetical protein
VTLAAPAAESPLKPTTAEPAPAAEARSVVTPAPSVAPLAAATGALRVHVAWCDTHHWPAVDAAGFVVRVLPYAAENPELAAREGTTDAQGIARFADLSPGAVLVSIDRHWAPPERVEIAAGATAELEISGPPQRFTLVGRVVDDSARPVADAEIWFARTPELAHGTRVGRSDADGGFRLDVLGHVHLGARAAGHLPSAIVYAFAAPGSEIPVVRALRAGAGEVRGSVVDVAGEPLAGALVRVGPPGPASPYGQTLDADWGRVARTGADGRFAVAGIAPGLAPVVVRRAGHALFRGEVEVGAGASA